MTFKSGFKIVGDFNRFNSAGTFRISKFQILCRVELRRLSSYFRALKHIPVAGEDDFCHHMQDRVGIFKPQCEILFGNLKKLAIFRRAHSGCARGIVQNGHFANHSPRSARTHILSIAVTGFYQDFYTACFNDIGAFPRVALTHNNFAGLKGFLMFVFMHAIKA